MTNNKMTFTKEEMVEIAKQIMEVANEMTDTDKGVFYYYAADRDGWPEERWAYIAGVKKK